MATISQEIRRAKELRKYIEHQNEQMFDPIIQNDPIAKAKIIQNRKVALKHLMRLRALS